MKRILIITTGGTIGSTIENGVISAEEGKLLAVALYKERYGGADITVLSAMDILSEELEIGHWLKLLCFIKGIAPDKYDGLIITHGSDTLSYSSAFFGLCLCGLDIPVALTAADLVPDDPRSNAVENLRACVEVIEKFRRGVFTVYKNPRDSFCSVYIATRIREADRVSGSFSSFDGRPFARIENGRFIDEPFSMTIDELYARTRPVILPDIPAINGSVLLVRPYPGMDHSALMLKKSVKAVLYITYHSSSAASRGSRSALSLLKRCSKKGIPFFLCSFGSSQTVYESSDTLIKNGALPLKHISDEAAFAKLILALMLGADDIYGFMQSEIYCEYI